MTIGRFQIGWMSRKRGYGRYSRGAWFLSFRGSIYFVWLGSLGRVQFGWLRRQPEWGKPGV